MRMLILKDNEQNLLLNTQLLSETDNIQYSIIERPVLEEKEGYSITYYLDENGEVQAKYVEIPQTNEEKIDQLEQMIIALTMSDDI